MAAALQRKLVVRTPHIYKMNNKPDSFAIRAQSDKMHLLYSIQSILEVADADLSWDTLPNRYRIQDALKFINTLIAIEK